MHDRYGYYNMNAGDEEGERYENFYYDLVRIRSESALWRVALAFGFVYDADDLIYALGRSV